PMPLIKLPFPTMVVASEDDPYVSVERAQHFAACWAVASSLLDVKGTSMPAPTAILGRRRSHLA
ncbi:MAG TPA: alpha/beta hydrolase, partial [Cytophagales bacterium]|nr:alpha/beta hydrolase [Cytophagales bacterium]